MNASPWSHRTVYCVSSRSRLIHLFKYAIRAKSAFSELSRERLRPPGRLVLLCGAAVVGAWVGACVGA